MRTTVILEDDVVAALALLKKQEGMSAKEVINAALREFVARRARKLSPVAYKSKSVDLGKCLVGSVEDVGEALAMAERDNYR
jgi:predicted transcriptional regulator